MTDAQDSITLCPQQAKVVPGLCQAYAHIYFIMFTLLYDQRKIRLVIFAMSHLNLHMEPVFFPELALCFYSSHEPHWLPSQTNCAKEMRKSNKLRFFYVENSEVIPADSWCL